MFVTLIATNKVSTDLIQKTDPSLVSRYAEGPIPPEVQSILGIAGGPGSYTKLNVGTGGFIAADLKGGGAYVKLNSTDLKPKEGVTNLSYRLEPGRALIFDRLVIEYATADPGTAVEDVTNWTKSLPAELAVGSIEIQSNNEKVYEGSLDVINNDQNNGSKPFHQLFDPRYIADAKQWDIIIKQPKAFSDATVAHYIKVHMDGLMTSIS